MLVINHISEVDPFIAAHIVYDHGRLPRYLAKAGLFKNKAARLLPALRRPDPGLPRVSRSAVGAYDAAVAAVRDGKCVVVYPEGTITRDPDLGRWSASPVPRGSRWPPACPVIPIGQWGAQEVLAPYAKKPDLFPRKLITMKVGDPVDLADLRATAADAPR